jgi:hypothetical protein
MNKTQIRCVPNNPIGEFRQVEGKPAGRTKHPAVRLDQLLLSQTWNAFGDVDGVTQGARQRKE